MAQAATWAWYLVAPGGTTYLGALTSAVSRKLSWTLDGAATAAFTMPASHPEAAAIAELATDLVAIRDGVTVFRGRIQASADSYAADADSVNFTAVDYRGMLSRRLFWSTSTLSFRGADQANIAWQMIADTQAQTGGNLGITRGTAPPTGVLRDRDYQAGKPVGEALAQLGEVINGFDWEIDGNLKFNLYYPQRGRATGLVLYWGREITAIDRTYDPSKYANAVFFTGGTGTTPVETALSTMPTGIGRWDAQASDPNLVLQDTVTDRAAYELAVASDFEPSFAVTMAEGGWDPGQLWLGDQAQIVADTGRINVNTVRRILQIDCTLTDDGGESVALTLGDATNTLTGRLQSYNSRIASLERAVGYIPDMPVGAMIDYAGTTPPQLYAWADGTWLDTGLYPELFAVIGYTYGGSGATFHLPDCRGRMTVAAGGGSGLTARTAGQIGGAETVALTAAQTGPHSHAASATTAQDVGDHSHHLTFNAGANTSAHTHGVNIVSATQNGDHQHNVALVQIQAGSGQWGVQNPPSGTNAATTGASGNHQHTVFGTTADDSTQGHGHPVIGDTGGESAHHTHQYTVTTDNGPTAGTGHENMPPWIAIGKVIKVMSAQAAGSS